MRLYTFLAGATLLVAASEPPPPIAQKFLLLFGDLRAAEAARSTNSPKHVAFSFTEDELNEYMRYALKASARPGIDGVTVKLFQNNYIATFTVVDFTAIEQWRPGTIPTLLRPVLNGKKTVEGKDNKHAKGVIALQHGLGNKDAAGVANDKGVIKFRKVEIKAL